MVFCLLNRVNMVGNSYLSCVSSSVSSKQTFVITDIVVIAGKADLINKGHIPVKCLSSKNLVLHMPAHCKSHVEQSHY